MFRFRPDRTTPRAALAVAFVALFVDMLIYGIAVPVLPQFPAVAAGGDAVTGILFAIYAGGLVAVTPLAGRWVDRTGPRGPLLAGLLGLAAATLLFAWVEALPLLMLARLAQGAAAACSWVAGLALVAATTPLRTRARNLGIVLSAVSMGVLIGPALGGILADTFGRHAPFLFAAGLALVDGLLRLWLIRPVEQANDDPGTVAGVARVRGAGAICVIVALGAALVAITEPVLPLRLSELGWSATQTGLVFGAAVFATACTTPIAGALTARVSIAVLAGTGGVMAATGLAVVAVAPAASGLVAGMAILGGGAGLVLGAITPAMTALGAQARPPALGASFALFNLAYAIGLFVGPTLGGIITDQAGFPPAMMILAALCIIVALVTSWRLSKFQSLTDPAAAESVTPASSGEDRANGTV